MGWHRYFVTLCTSDRRAVFTNATNVQVVLTEILHAATARQFAIITFCFMPDHVHLLLEGRSDDARLRAFVSAVKQRSGYAFSAHNW